MSGNVPGREVYEILHEHFGGVEGWLITDPDFPVSETSALTIEVEGYDPEHFHVWRQVGNRCANVVHRKLCERYVTLSIAIRLDGDFDEDGHPHASRALIRRVAQGRLFYHHEGDRLYRFPNEEGGR